jgi:hypothetical protein
MQDALSVLRIPLQDTRRGFVPRFDLDDLGLVLESAREMNWPHGATIDGIITLDLDEDRTLANVELMWPRRRWPRGEEAVPAKSPGLFALRLPALSTDTLSDSLGIDVAQSNTTLLIKIVDRSLEGYWDAEETLSVGDDVSALVKDEALVGFVITLPT